MMFVKRCTLSCCLVGIALLTMASCSCGGSSPDADAMDAAALPDAPPSDSDAAVLDAALLDAAVVDAGLADAAPPDAFVADAGPHPIGPLAEGLSTLVGDSATGLVNGPREFSLFSNPVNVVVGPSGDIFVADFNNAAIRRVTPDGDTITLTRQPGFSRPFGMAFTPSGEFFVQTDHNSTGLLTGALYQVALDTGIATLRVDDSGRVRGMASLSDGRIVLADPFLHVIQIYDPADDSIELLAGSSGLAEFADGTGAAAHFNRPVDLAVSSIDEVYVSDSRNHRIRKLTLAGVVTTIAGDGNPTSVDGSALLASFSEPTGIALTEDDATLYICEFNSGLIREITDDSVTTIAGSTFGFADNIDPLLAQLSVCEGVDVAAEYLYIADGNGGTNDAFNRVRRLELETDPVTDPRVTDPETN